jgi:1A family penicillin-binding protein
LLLLTGGFYWVTTPLPEPHHLRAQAAQGNTRLLDRHGNLLYEVPDPFSGHQQPLPLDEIPLALQQATIAIEDRTFYQNSGIDPRGILRAAWHNLTAGEITAGGSTITQQLARNFLLDPQQAQQRTLHRKLRETVLAVKLTTTLSKQEVLALYLNQTYYGGLSYGVEAAARHFFGKPARDLGLAECALLAGLPQAPSAYNPFTHAEQAKARQHAVLAAMVRENFITPERAVLAREEPLQFATDAPPLRAPHFVIYVLDQLASEVGSEALARGGLTITTTLDLALQEAARSSLQNHLARLAETYRDEPDHQVRNGAVIVLEPQRGDILAMVGSPDFANATIQGQVNATLAPRQPGSAIKPLTYAAALQRGWTAATTIVDEPTSFPTRENIPYTPENYDQQYQGAITLREALATSSNVAAVKTLHAIGVPALLHLAEQLGISTLHEKSGRYGLALTLGGGEVTLLELSAAYAAFANGGMRTVPQAVWGMENGEWRMENARGRTAVRGQGSGVNGRESTEPARVLSREVAFLISDILSDRYARMHAFGLASVLDVDRPAAVKTGTTTDWRDNWTIGYTPDRVVGVWVGNADGAVMHDITGISGAGPIWHEVMLAAHRGLPPRTFVPPAGIIEREICSTAPAETPLAECSMTRMEYFRASEVRGNGNGECRMENGECRTGVRGKGNGECRMENAECRTVVRGQGSGFGVREGENQVPLSTPHSPLPTVELLSPADGSRYTLSKAVPAEHQRVVIAARASGDIASLSLLLDGEVLASFNAPPYRAFWQLTPGEHTAWVEATDSSGKVVRSRVVEFVVEG